MIILNLFSAGREKHEERFNERQIMEGKVCTVEPGN